MINNKRQHVDWLIMTWFAYALLMRRQQAIFFGLPPRTSYAPRSSSKKCDIVEETLAFALGGVARGN